MKREVLILGAGDHGQVVADILLAARAQGAGDTPVGFLDDDERLRGARFLGLPVLGTISELSDTPHDAVIVAIGDNAVRRRLYPALRERGERLVNAIHPTATLASGVRLGEGVMICAGAVLETGCIIGNAAIVNTNCVIGHHSRLGDYAHISGCAVIGGHVQIGEGAMVGIGSAILPGLTVGDWSVVGVGSAAARDVPAQCVAMGVPARIIPWDRRRDG